jgi:protein TIF31
MLQSLRQHQASLPWFERSLTLCSELHGKDSLNAATISFQYSQALALAGDPIGAVPKMRHAYATFAKELGPEDRSTKETEFLLQAFTTNAVNVAKQAKLGKKVAAPNVKVSSMIQAVGAEVAAVDGAGSRGLQNIDELVKYIGGDTGGSSSGGGAERQKSMQKKRRGGKR